MCSRALHPLLPSLPLLLALGAFGCGPKTVSVKAADVKTVAVRPRSGQPVFCPGAPFEVEVVAQMVNGDTCSTTTAQRCEGSDKALLDKRQIVVVGSDSIFEPETMLLRPSGDVFQTAAGVELKGWVLGAEQKAGVTRLKPVYDCLATSEYDGGYGGQGPSVEVAATKIDTPYYKHATLVRIRSDGFPPRYVIAPQGMVVRVFAAGGPGLPGEDGASGQQGAQGAAGSQCGNGGAGGAGTNGGPGGPGGDGGPGGLIVAMIDNAAFGEISAQLDLETPGGDPGPGGRGGAGGAGGAGGSAGSSDDKRCPSGGVAGPAGPSGTQGQDGADGRPGPDGPAPKVVPVARAAIFAEEMAKIEKVEGLARQQ